jgi:hypothetical protein
LILWMIMLLVVNWISVTGCIEDIIHMYTITCL